MRSNPHNKSDNVAIGPTRVKIFEDHRPNLEREINAWISEQGPIEVLDIKFAAINTAIFAAMVIYEPSRYKTAQERGPVL